MVRKPSDKRRPTIAFDRGMYTRRRLFCIEKEGHLSDAVNAAVEQFVASKR